MEEEKLKASKRHSNEEKKMAKKKKKKKRKLADTEESDEDVKRLQAVGESTAQDSKKEKKEKSRKKRKRKLDENSEVDVEAEVEVVKAKKKKKKEKKQKKLKKAVENEGSDSEHENPEHAGADKGIVESSAIEFYDEQVKRQKMEQAKKETTRAQDKNTLTLLLFYQYVEPVWDEATYSFMIQKLQKVGKQLDLSGRMRVAREGLNCTLTGTHESILEYCQTLKKIRPKDFANTEFKLTTDLPKAQKFPNLKVLKVIELVHYGLEGSKAPPIAKFQGTHLEPKDYHKKIAEQNTVIIDVRNHYEAAIGRFVPPGEDGNADKDQTKASDNEPNSAKWLDPKMRKSTEFPVWLDKPETKEMMKGKQVLMYCTGGIRCERASALLKYKMETDPEIKDLGIKGVFQLQGGIDKYFKEFPDGGYWKGKNYVFDKRFAHAPPKVDGELHGQSGEPKVEDSSSGRTAAMPATASQTPEMMGKCESCLKPWDMYRGKRRCPTCGVPSLICRECFLADKEGRRKLGKEVRCDLCVEQGIFSKRELREKDQREIEEYEQKMQQRGLLKPEEGDVKAPNPDSVTRLHLKNMCRKNMDEATLLETIPGITHLVWRIDRKSNKFLGQAWVEMATPDDAARAVARDGKVSVFGRPMYISFQAPGGKDAWPPPNSAVHNKK